jgi:ABC-type multidrug transport system permease subunit
MVRAHKDAVTWIARFFPNTYAVDPLRDLVLFNTWPVDFWQVTLILIGFASLAILLGAAFAKRSLRRIA